MKRLKKNKESHLKRSYGYVLTNKSKNSLHQVTFTSTTTNVMFTK
ncbi:hypothetical protein AND_002339 [Anopheles darlingi]|uniref:Uncharacterized protein n=1 Tax=Anopheles darlingi TaxID=43151 RepID=W5JT03_ANODA|nr:hypothetical protein AND_002339 [Anopheles darlingi]